jgi:hypothetical protein
MSKIPTIAEQQLANLQPGKLNADFMSRLVACADGSMTELNPEEIQFEAYLKKFAPSRISLSAQTALLEALDGTPFHVDEKIVLFHKSNAQKGANPTKSRRFNLAAAAAVALLGSLAALINPGQPQQDTASTPPVNQSPTIASPVSNSFSPAGFNRNLKDTRDVGVIWNGPQGPHRVLRFTYMDRVTLKNEKGELIQVEQPREEFVIIPEKVD